MSKFRPIGTPTLILGEVHFAFEDREGHQTKGSVTQGVVEDLALILKQPQLEPTAVFAAFKNQIYAIAYELKSAGRPVRIDLPVMAEFGLTFPDAA